MNWTWSLLFLLAAGILFLIASGWPFWGAAGNRWNEGLIAAGLACFMASILAGGH